MKARLINVDKDKLCECLAMACPMPRRTGWHHCFLFTPYSRRLQRGNARQTPLAMSIRLHSLATKQVETMRTDKMHHHQEIHHETD